MNDTIIRYLYEEMGVWHNFLTTSTQYLLEFGFFMAQWMTEIE